MGKVYLMLLLLAILATHSTVKVTLNSIVTFILDNLTLPTIQIWDITINLQLQDIILTNDLFILQVK